MTKPLSSPASRKTAHALRAVGVKEALWLSTLLLAVFIVYLSPVKEELGHVRKVHQDIEALGPVAELSFLLGAVLITALGFPRMLVFPVAGLAFGFPVGLALSIIALLGGGYLPFCYARWGGRGWITRQWPRMARLADYFQERTYKTVVLFRILPMPGFLTNAFLGITHIKHRSFILGTALGSIPPGIPATLLGSSLIEEGPVAHLYAGGSMILFVALWFVIPFSLRHHPNIRLLKEVLATSRPAHSSPGS